MFIQKRSSQFLTIIKIFFTLHLSVIYFLSGFTKRKKNIWIFGSYHDTFSDNSKYFFQYIKKNHNEIEAYWVTNSNSIFRYLKGKEFNVLKKYSLKSFYYGLKAKVIIISSYRNNVNAYVIRNAFIVNLWHGIPLKNIEYDIPSDFNDDFLKKRNFFRKLSYIFPIYKLHYNLLIASSEIIRNILARAFKISLDQIAITGEPASDILINKMNNNENKYISYLPTFRSNRNYNYFQTDFEPAKWEKTLKEMNLLLKIKLHPSEKTKIENYKSKFMKYNRIQFACNDEDVYELLLSTKVLITDYSSIMFDFSLTQKPIVFLAPDLREYLISERPMYFNYEELTGNNIFHDWESLRQYFENNKNLEIKRNSILINKLNKYSDGFSCKRVYEEINSRI